MWARLFGIAAIAASCLAAGPTHGRAAPAASAATCPPAVRGVHRYAPGSGRTVALTFDDGPGHSTQSILRIPAQPATVRAEYRAGFALGDHTWDHKDLTLLGPAAQAGEIDRERRAESSITGADPCLLRPPYGNYDATTLALAQQRGMRLWDWSVDPEDWKAAGSAAQYWVHRIISRAEAGGGQRHPVILMHNQPAGNPATVAALPAIIKFYRARGYAFVDLYGHTGPPVIGRISPASAPLKGGIRITVTGYGFLGVRRVGFGDRDGRSIHVESNRRLTVICPAHPPGRITVRVTTTFGTSTSGPASVFRYARATG
jgi:peptidoglycan/xylan/chitin deacetylase (PgdA/CDA1 family)